MIDPDLIFTRVALVVFAVAAFDLGIAFLIRSLRESSGGDDRD